MQLYALSEKEYPQNWLDVDDPGSVGVAEGATDVAGSLAFGTTGLSADTVTALKNAYGLKLIRSAILAVVVRRNSSIQALLQMKRA